MNRPRFLATLAATLTLGWALPMAAQAAEPIGSARTLTLVVPFPPGAGPDLVARTLAEKIAAQTGQAVVVDNKPGAGGLVGAAAVARSQPDGGMLLLAPNTLVISPHVLPKGAGGGIDVLKDLLPVAPIATTPMLLVANPQAGIRDVAQLRAAAAKPGAKLSYGSAGNGSPMHFAGELLDRAADLKMLHVPYRGAAPSVVAAIGGEVPLVFVALGGAAGQIKAGKLVAVGVAEKARTRLLPEVPTLGEQGVPGVEVNAWYGVFAPAGTPAALVNRWNEALVAALKLPDVAAKLEAAGIEVTPGSPEALAAMSRADFERYGRMTRDYKIQAD